MFVIIAISAMGVAVIPASMNSTCIGSMNGVMGSLEDQITESIYVTLLIFCYPYHMTVRLYQCLANPRNRRRMLVDDLGCEPKFCEGCCRNNR